ncbi:S8 family serine peptidase [Oceanospirillaceae bacterium ASx5O]|nr:S8 family serine peptidase [Oceanospirillaceae bacterium ASx5O]
MPIRSHVRPVVMLLSSLWLAACGGGGGFIEVPKEPDAPASQFNISGRLSIAAGISVDGDTNDRFAEYTNNDDPSDPQIISNNALVHGFASARGTGGDSSQERFTTTIDENDYYRVNLQQGQTVRLQVVDASVSNDLDLYLLDSSGTNDIDFSKNEGETGNQEEVSAPTDGEYLINVNAFSGISKYILQILPASSTTVAPPADFVAGELVVQYKPAVGIASRSNATQPRPQLVTMNSARTAMVSSNDPLQVFNPELYEKRRTLIEAKRMQKQDDVEWAEPNYIVQPTLIPNDTRYARQWHYPAINLPQAWDLSTGNATPEVIVAVIDTGVYLAHPDLAPKLVPGYDFISSTSISRDGDGIDASPDDPGDNDTPGASSWHGSHVAGTVAASSNNGMGVTGVSWGAKIMPLRALGKGGGTTYDVAQSIRFAAGLSNDSTKVPARKADIINLSLGSSQATSVEQNAIAAARSAGVIIVAAAGNENVSTPFYPAAYEGVIGVSATNPQVTKASYSNFGTYVDIAAPGGEMQQGVSFGVLSTVADDSSGVRVPAVAFSQGTSMAAPHVAGVIALMKAVHPGLTETQFMGLLSTCAITNKTTACARDNQLGYGQIDAYKAVAEARRLAAGGTTPALPAIVQSDKTQLFFASTVSEQSFVLSNVGDNDVANLQITDSSSWLTITPSAGVSDGLGTYTASVNRTGLIDGEYTGTIRVTYEDSTAAGVTKTLQLSVTMQVGTVISAGVMTQQYVLLEDADCVTEDCVLQTVFADSSTGYFVFNGVEPGNYRLYAGSDIDVDGLICGAGETCGAYPSLGAEQIIRITDRNVTGRDFLLNLNGAGGVASSGTLQIQNLQPAGQPGKAR